MQHKKQIGLLGAGGQADEVESYLGNDTEVLFRAVSAQYLDPTAGNQIDIAAPGEADKSLPVIAAVGAPAIRKALVDSWAGNDYHTLVSDRASVDGGTKLGAGTTIAPMAVVTSSVVIGRHGLINVGATVSHDVRLGDYVTVSPGSHLAGRVTLGDGVFVGIGASINSGVKIASGSVIGAGAVVLEDVTEENSVVVGVPAKVIKQNDGWLREV